MTDGPTPKPWIAAIHAYVPGKSRAADGRALIKLSANENPLGTSPLALAARAEAAIPSLYPDPDSTALREALGKLHGIDPARIVCGTGSGELLTVAASAFAGPGDEVLYVRYGFSLYEIAARRCGATPVEAPDADYGTDVDALLALVNDKTRVVFIANPNNPTGSYLSKAELTRLHAGLPPQVLLVIDQAYAEYVAPDNDDGGLELAAAHANVLVTRTFAKAYGLAGERVGWGTGAPELIELLNRLRGPFNVNNCAQAVATAALADQDFVTRSREHNRAERARFVAAIETLGNRGLRALPSEANFVLVLFEGALSAEAAHDALMEHNRAERARFAAALEPLGNRGLRVLSTEANFVLVLFEGALTAEAAHNGLMEHGYATRWLPGQGLPHGLRITIGTVEQMTEIAAILRELAEERQ